MTVVSSESLTTETVDSSTAETHLCDQPSEGQLPSESATEATPDLSGITVQVVNTLREWYVLASDSISSLLEGRLMQEPSRDLWLLGKHYELADQADEQQSTWAGGYPTEVIRDFSRLIWCTYRSQYPPIAPSAFTTDAGWGCMLRAGQTLLAQALQLHHFGREWLFDWDSFLEEDVHRRQQYIGVVKQFFDDYSSSSTFSIHRMASLGNKFEGKDIGQWFGPYGTAAIIRELAQKSDHELSIYTTTDGVVYLADICEPDFKPTLILVATMLGIDRVNPVYYPFIQASLTLPQSAGIAGGRPSSALYFAGFQGDALIYLDPHFTRPATTHRQDDAYTQSDLATYSCNTPRRIALGRLDPCMVFGYYCGTLESLIDLRCRIDLLGDDGMKTIMSFENGNAPNAQTHILASSAYCPTSPETSAAVSTGGALSDSSGLLVRLPQSQPPSPNGSDEDGSILVNSSDVGVGGDDGGGDDGESDRLGQSKSESDELVLEEDASEDEWVTDL